MGFWQSTGLSTDDETGSIGTVTEVDLGLSLLRTEWLLDDVNEDDNAERQRINNQTQDLLETHAHIQAQIDEEADEVADETSYGNGVVLLKWEEEKLKFPSDSHVSPDDIAYADIIIMVTITFRRILAMDSMKCWIPANLFLDYINRELRLQQRDDLPRERFYDFLESCEAHKKYFSYSRLLHGKVGRIDAGWPLQDPVVKTQPAEFPQHGLFRRHFARLHRSGSIIYEYLDELGDIDEDFFFHRVRNLFDGLEWRADDGPSPNPLDRGVFDLFMARLDFYDDLWT